MPARKNVNWDIVLPVIKEVYEGMLQVETLEYIKRVTGEDITKSELSRRASIMGLKVSQEVKSRKTVERNKARFLAAKTEKQLNDEAHVKIFYPDKGKFYVAEVTGLTPAQVVVLASRLKVQLNPEMKRHFSNPGSIAKWQEKNNPAYKKKRKVKTVRRGKALLSAVCEPYELNELERLALYKPWGKRHHEMYKINMEKYFL